MYEQSRVEMVVGVVVAGDIVGMACWSKMCGVGRGFVVAQKSVEQLAVVLAQ